MRLLLSICFAFQIISAFSQQEPGKEQACSFNLKGTVKEEHTLLPLSYAEIFIEELNRGVIADERGRFLISAICEGNYTVTCRHIGCTPVHTVLQIDAHTEHTFFLHHTPHELGEISIIEERLKKEETKIEEVITEKQLMAQQGLSLGEITKSANGVSALQTGPTIYKPMVHGLHSNRLIISNDGVRHEAQRWGTDHAPEIDVASASQVHIIKGPNTLEYGSDALGGVVALKQFPLRYNNPGTSGNFNLTGATNNGLRAVSGKINFTPNRFKNFSTRIWGTLKQAGNIKTPGYYLDNTGFKEWNYGWKVGYKKEKFEIEAQLSQFNSNLGVFSGAHIGNLTDLLNAFAADRPIIESGFSYEIGRPYQQIEHENFNTTVKLPTGEESLLSVKFARQFNLRFEFDKEFSRFGSYAQTENDPELGFKNTTHTLDLRWEHKIGENLKGKVGWNSMTRKNTFTGRFFIPNYKSLWSGLYWIFDWTGPKTNAQIGARYDYKEMQAFIWNEEQIEDPRYVFSLPTFSAAVAHQFRHNLNVRLSGGLSWRPPLAIELFADGVHHGAAAFEVGNQSLTEERSQKVSIEIDHKHEGFLKTNLTLYHQSITDFIFMQPSLAPTLTIRGAFPTFDYRQANVHIRGIDGTVDLKVTSNLDIEIRGSLIRGFNKSLDDHLIFMPSDQGQISINRQFLAKNSNPLFSLSVSMRGVSKQTRVPQNSDYVDPPEGYCLFGLRLEKGFIIGNQKIQTSIEVSNLLNKSYRNYLNRFRYYADEMGRNLIVRISVPFEVNNNKSNHL